MRLTCLLAGAVVVALAAPVLRGDEVMLVTGELMKGDIVELAPEHVILEHPVLGRMKIPVAQVLYVTQDEPLPADPAADPAAPESMAPEAAAPQPEAPGPDLLVIPMDEPETPTRGPVLTFLHDNNVQFELGLNGASGNSETTDLRAAAKAGRESETRRWAFDAAYFYSKSDGDSTRNDSTIGLVHDWLKPESPWFLFAQGRADFDDFQDWDSRVNGAAGVGYQWIKTDTLNVRLRVGAGAVKEFGSDNEDVRPEGSVGGELTWKIKPNQTLAAAVTAFPSFDDAGEVRVRASADWTLKVDQADGISIKLGVLDEYDSLAGAGTDKNDFKYYAALVVDF